jgi:hypothetical protein
MDKERQGKARGKKGERNAKGNSTRHVQPSLIQANPKTSLLAGARSHSNHLALANSKTSLLASANSKITALALANSRISLL